ncbi:transcriptional regulator [human gut metagenome]|uniref:Transcriptional regulator n=1 Tax=human gut metagenome TaxID=408170 RepID=K1SCN2_9ZZZZ
MPDFTCRLKQFRLAKGLTQEQLASAVGVRRETIMRLEKAQYNPSLKLAVDISRTVEAPIEEIFILSKAVTTIHSLKLWKENLYDYLQ